MFDGALAGFFGNTFTLWAILSLAALGGLLSERSGIINIGLEGKMLIAACVMAVGSAVTGSPYLGLVMALASAVLLSLAHFVLTQVYRVDHIVSGMAVNLFALGATNYLNTAMKAQLSTSAPTIPVTAFAGLTVVLSASVAVALIKTRGGLRLLAVGNDPDKSRESGINPVSIRFRALILTGLLCGLSGALVLSNTGTFSDNMTAGRGFIALAALIVGGWQPLRTVGACVLFAALEAAQTQVQGQTIAGITIRPEVAGIAPYFITLLALGGLIGKVKAPSGLGKA